MTDVVKTHDNLSMCNFKDHMIMTKNIVEQNISYLLPFSPRDNWYACKCLTDNKLMCKILYPTDQNVELLDNKISFTKFMLEHYPENIPDVYYLKNVELKPICYPAIYKPERSVSATGIVLVHNINDLDSLENRCIIQKFINDRYEYGAYALCVDGKALRWKIIRYAFEEFNIKKTVFPTNYENVENFDVGLFDSIVSKINYTGGICINFKYVQVLEPSPDENKIYVFEINPRFGGSAFYCGFFSELIEPLSN